jgi:hypothetical protein
MNVKGLVSKYLKSHGVIATKNALGLNFTYEGWNFLFWNDADDPLFFRLTLPGIFDVTDDNFAKAIMACNNIRLCSHLFKIWDNCKKNTSIIVNLRNTWRLTYILISAP